MRGSKGQVLVVGGSGFYGQYVVADLLKHTTANITIASRHPKPASASSERVSLAACDLNDLPRLTQLAGECDILIHCAGPFQHLPLNPLQAAMAAQCDYIDLSEDRAFARRVKSLAPEIAAAGIRVFSGASVCPALEALFALVLQPRFDRLTAIRTIAAPDTRKHRGPAMFHTMLWGVGRGWDEPFRGGTRRAHGWTEPEWVEFPPPVGRRLTFLVLEMANLDLLPELFGVEHAAFKAGTEHSWLNRTLHASALFRMTAGFPAWERITPLVRGISWLAGRFGKDEGGVIFEVAGIKNDAPLLHRLALMADKDGGWIPSVLAAMLAEELLRGKEFPRGLVPIPRWIEPTRLLAGLQQRGMKLWWQESDRAGWKELPTATDLTK